MTMKEPTSIELILFFFSRTVNIAVDQGGKDLAKMQIC